MALITPELPPELWVSYVRKIAQGSQKPNGTQAPVIQQRRALNIVAAREALGKTQSQTQIELLKFERVAWAYAQRTTPETYVDLGRGLGLKFIQAIEERLRRGQPLVPSPHRHEDQGFIALVGSFPHRARQSQLIPRNGLTDRVRCMLQALFIGNWNAALKSRIAMGDYLRPLERICLLRWRVEVNQASSIERRIAAAKELARAGGYPGAHNGAILLWQAGKRAEALRLAQSSKDPVTKILAKRLADPAATR